MDDNAAPPTNAARPAPPWVWLHHSLMPDYNAKATAYWWTVVALGSSAFAYAALTVAALPLAALAQVLVGMVIAMLAGFFPVRIGRSKSSFAAGEVFIVLLLLLHGPAAATLAACCETLVGGLRMSRRWTSRIASPSMAALAMTAAGHALAAVLALLQRLQLTNPGLLMVATIGFALLYFGCNAALMAALPRF